MLFLIPLKGITYNSLKITKRISIFSACLNKRIVVFHYEFTRQYDS